METNLSLVLLSCGLIALVLNEDVKFVGLEFGDIGVEAIDEHATGATATLDGTAFGGVTVDACVNWAWFNISPPPIMNIVD